MSWFDATNYCALRTQQETAAGSIPTNCAYRLPIDAEWEYADRAGTTTAFYLGNHLYSGQANFDGHWEYDASAGTVSNANGIYIAMPTPVGSYPPNPWGLYDMIGNVWEWCQDWWTDYSAESLVDPQGGSTGLGRVIRGGSFYGYGLYSRSATRGGPFPTDTASNFGFRVVLALR